MFFTLLLVTFILSIGVAFIVVRLFDKPIAGILERIIKDPISLSWHRYIIFATYVVGISGGVRIYNLERYVSSYGGEAEVLVLNMPRWTLEIYRTIIETLQSIAWMYLIFFIVALIAYVIIRGFESKHTQSDKQ